MSWISILERNIFHIEQPSFQPHNLELAPILKAWNISELPKTLHCLAIYFFYKRWNKCILQYVTNPIVACAFQNSAVFVYISSAVCLQFALQVIDVDIDLVAHHRGFFAFKLCPQNNPTETVLASCFDKYPLKLENGERFYHLAKNNIHGPGRVKAKVQLPIGLTCWHCILQTTYVSGNFLTNFILVWNTL